MNHNLNNKQCNDGSMVNRLKLNLNLIDDNDVNASQTQTQTTQSSLQLQCNVRTKPTFLLRRDDIDAQPIDVTLTIEMQGWFHGHITRIDAENLLRHTKEGSYLVRTHQNTKLVNYFLSLKSVKGFMHIKIVNQNSQFILGNSSISFNTIPELINHYSVNRIPIRGAEHMSLLYPVIDQLL